MAQIKRFQLLAIILFAFVTTTAAAKPFTVLLDWFVNPSHAPLFVASHFGFWQKQHLDVKLLSPSSPNTTVKLVASGKADLALTYQPHFIEQQRQGLALRQVGVLIDKPLDRLVTIPSVKRLSDLKGKRVGTSATGAQSVMLQALIRYAHLHKKSFTLLHVNYDLLQGFLAHRLDAVSGMMANFEVLKLKQMGVAFHSFKPEQYGFPPYSELIFVGRQDESKKTLTKFFSGLQQATRFLERHPVRCWQAFIKAYPSLNNPLNAASWQMSLADFSRTPGHIDHKRIQRLKRFMFKGGSHAK